MNALAQSNGPEIATAQVRRGRVKWLVRAGVELPALEELLANPDGAISRATILRDSILVTLARLPAPGGGGRSWLLRRTNYGKPLARVRDFFRVAAPVRAFRNALEFDRAGIPTPRVIAAGIVRQFQKPIAGYLIVEEIPSVHSLAEFLKAHQSIPHRAIEQVGATIAKLHEHGLIHGDLTIANVLLDAQLQPWFVDLDRAKKSARPIAWRAAVEDFYRFARHVPTLGPGARFGAWRLLKEYCTRRGWAGREREFAADIFERLKQKVKGYRL